MLSLLVLLTSLSALQPTGQTTEANAPGTVTGRVVDIATGEPISGADVFADSTPVVFRDRRMRAVNAADEQQVSATDEHGNFELRLVPPGLRSIKAVLPLKNLHSAAVSLSVEPNKTKSGVTIRLARPATISGIVTNEEGKPLAGVRIAVVAAEFSAGRRRAFLKAQVRTGSDGTYVLKDLVPVNRNVRLLADWLPNQGKVFSDTRTPASLEEREPAYRPSFYMGDSDPESGLSLQLKSGEQLEHIDFRLRPQTSFCAAGKILANPEAGKLILMMDRDHLSFGMSRHGAAFGWGLVGDLTAGSRFRVCGLVSGDYSLHAHSDLYGGGAEKLAAFGQLKFTVGDHDLEGLELHLGSPRSLKVVVECGDKCPEDQDLGKLNVSLLPTARSWLVGESFSASIGIPGSVVLPRVLTDEYSLVARLPKGGIAPLYVKQILFGTADLRYQSFQVDSQFPDEVIRIIISPKAASLSVRVDDDRGKPVGNMPLFLMPKDARTEAELAERLILGETDADGLCHFAGSVPPGEYKMVAARLNVDFSPEFIRALWGLRDRASELELKPSAAQNLSVKAVN